LFGDIRLTSGSVVVSILEIFKQYKTAQWQQKRFEILQRDNFSCRCCGGDYNLQIHHLYYQPKLKVWEYDNEALVTVCESCHQSLTFELPKLAGIIAFKILSSNIDVVKINSIIEEAKL